MLVNDAKKMIQMHWKTLQLVSACFLLDKLNVCPLKSRPDFRVKYQGQRSNMRLKGQTVFSNFPRRSVKF